MARRAARSPTTAPRWPGSRPLVEAAEPSCPATASPHDRETALRILDEDVDYLDALERGDERPALPKGRDTARQRAIHEENLAHVGEF